MIDIIFDLLKKTIRYFYAKPKFHIRPQHDGLDITATSLGITTFVANKSSRAHNITKISWVIEEISNQETVVEQISVDPRLPIRLEPNDTEKMVRFTANVGKLPKDKERVLKITFFSWWKNKETPAGHTEITLCRPGDINVL